MFIVGGGHVTSQCDDACAVKVRGLLRRLSPWGLYYITKAAGKIFFKFTQGDTKKRNM